MPTRCDGAGNSNGMYILGATSARAAHLPLVGSQPASQTGRDAPSSAPSACAVSQSAECCRLPGCRDPPTRSSARLPGPPTAAIRGRARAAWCGCRRGKCGARTVHAAEWYGGALRARLVRAYAALPARRGMRRGAGEARVTSPCPEKDCRARTNCPWSSAVRNGAAHRHFAQVRRPASAGIANLVGVREKARWTAVACSRSCRSAMV